MVTYNTLNLVPVQDLPGFDPIETGCPACGEPIDYCQGHGLIGDPTGYAKMVRHDADDHDACSPFADCQLEIARCYVEDTHQCDNTTCEIDAAARLGFIRIAASRLSSTGLEYDGVYPNMNGGIDWPEDDAWTAIVGTRPKCPACESTMYVPITEGMHQCGNCLAEIEIDMVDILRGRSWAGDYHPGQMSGAYAFMSSGTVTLSGVDYFHKMLKERDASAQDRFEYWAILYSMGATLDSYLDWT